MLPFCYESEWQLFRGHPEIRTRGRYVFCPPETPFAPVPHHFGARIYTSDERDPQPPLGECNDTKHVWCNGQTPDPFPEPGVIGNADCFENGETEGVWGNWQKIESNDTAPDLDLDPTWTFPETVACSGAPGNTSFQLTAERPFFIPTDGKLLWKLTGSLPGGPDPLVTVRGTVDSTSLFDETNDIFSPSCSSHPWERSGSIHITEGLHTIAMYWRMDSNALSLGGPGSVTVEFTTDPPILDRHLQGGFAYDCYAHPLRPPVLPPPPDIIRRDVRTTFAGILALQYSDQAAADSLFAEFLGPTYTYTSTPNDNVGLFPGVMIAARSDVTIVVVSGTTSFQQLATQAAYTLLPPQEVSGVGTSVFWFAGSLYLQSKIAASTADPAKPFILVGHSYGGVLCAILAARLKLGDPGRGVDVLGYGTPKPGDQTLHDQLDLCRAVWMANEGDPTPNLPPGRATLPELAWLIPLPIRLSYIQWIKPTRQKVLTADGIEFDSMKETVDISDLAIIAGKLITGIPLGPLVDHDILVYLERLRKF